MSNWILRLISQSPRDSLIAKFGDQLWNAEKELRKIKWKGRIVHILVISTLLYIPYEIKQYKKTKESFYSLIKKKIQRGRKI